MSRFSTNSSLNIAIFAVATLAAMPAFAHSDGALAAMSMAAGFGHPFSGLDHVLAMVAVGLWAVQQRRHAPLWVLPLAFVTMMIVGAGMGFAGMSLPAVETGIAGSVAVLGLLVACAVSLPVWAGALVVALFAMMHGHAHGAELPRGAAFACFIAATALLHGVGILIGLIAGKTIANRVLQLGGAGIAATGVYLLAV